MAHRFVSVLLLLYSLQPGTTVASRRLVNWYMGGGAIDANVAFVTNYSASLTGLYLCCNSYSFLANGSFVGVSDETIRNQTLPLLAVKPDLHLYYVIGINNNSLVNESWRIGISTAVETLYRLKDVLNGFIVDYEPANNYTVQHSQAYANFLSVFAAAIHDRSNNTQGLGMDVAGWGILNRWDIYNTTNLDIYTSMTPTYYGNNLTLNEEFVLSEISSLPIDTIGIGIGSMLVTAPEWNYNYTEEKLSTFINFLTQTDISRIDIWRADIDHYGITVDYYFQLLEQFLQGK